MLERLRKSWLAVSIIVLLLSILMQRSFGPGYVLTVYGDLIELILNLLIVGIAVRWVFEFQGRSRWFWIFITLGNIYWTFDQSLWVYREVIAREPIPNMYLGDSLLILMRAPMLAGLACRPHLQFSRRRDSHILDFFILMAYWVYLHAFLIITWQFIDINEPKYNLNYNVLGLVTDLIWAVSLLISWRRCTGYWRGVYGWLGISALFFAFGTLILDIAVQKGQYYTGAPYDLAIIASQLFYVRGVIQPHENIMPRQSSDEGNWLSNWAIMVVFTVPVFGLSVLFTPPGHHKLVIFRLFVTFITMIGLVTLLFIKQRKLEGDLFGMLHESEESLDRTKRLQEHIIQSEKMTSLGRMVGGAAHEINNPLTAIMGYSTLLATDLPPDETRNIALKIGQQGRRIENVVKSLLAFAKQSPGERKQLNLNGLVSSLVALCEFEIARRQVTFDLKLSHEGLLVTGDTDQLSQAFMKILNNAIDAVSDRPNGTISVMTRADQGHAVIEIADNGPGVADPRSVFDPFYSTKPIGKGAGLGLSACYGIIREHQGEIACKNQEQGGAVFTIRLPLDRNGNEN